MAIVNKDIVELTADNKSYRKEVYRDDNRRVVVMSIQPGDDIGEEAHDADQTTSFVAGEGQAVLDGHGTKVTPNHTVVIPKGTRHDITNKGEGPPKLSTAYSPPAEGPGISHRTKAEAAEG